MLETNYYKEDNALRNFHKPTLAFVNDTSLSRNFQCFDNNFSHHLWVLNWTIKNKQKL